MLPSLLGDIRNPRWLYFKGILMLLVGLLASVILVLQSPTLRTAVLLGVAVWGFCQAYYFAFYVVEKYADQGFRFAGLWAFVRYAWSRKKMKSVRMTSAYDVVM
jgi:hypothetical protein